MNAIVTSYAFNQAHYCLIVFYVANLSLLDNSFNYYFTGGFMLIILNKRYFYGQNYNNIAHHEIIC